MENMNKEDRMAFEDLLVQAFNGNTCPHQDNIKWLMKTQFGKLDTYTLESLYESAYRWGNYYQTEYPKLKYMHDLLFKFYYWCIIQLDEPCTDGLVPWLQPDTQEESDA